MIDRELKRSIGQMMKGVQVVGASHEGLIRAYTSHWVCQVSFEEPILMASVSPKHDTHPLIVGSRRFAVSVLAGDQIEQGQYFSYPGRKFKYVGKEYLTTTESGLPVVVDAIAWLECEVFEHRTGFESGPELDHDLFFAQITNVHEGRLGEPPLLYSSRLGWRVTGDKARERGESVRDRLLAKVEETGQVS